LENNLYSIDLFSGAGGMSLGAEMAGITTKIAIESDVNAANTFKKNFPHAEVICDDICNVNLNISQHGNPFIIYGGPPCRGFSLSNSKTRNKNNPLNKLFYEFIKQVKIFKPKWVVFENVEGFKTFEKGETVDILTMNLTEIGYKCTYQVLSANDYGVPQNRRRFILVANLLDIDFTFPQKNKKKFTVEDAISDLPELKNGDSFQQLAYKTPPSNSYQRLLRKKCTQNIVSKNQDYVINRYKHIGQGENWKSVPKELMKNYKDTSKCHSGIYRRLNLKEASVVISNYRKNMLIHPTEDRGLSIREAARLQSFPDSFTFEGSLMHVQQQIGNAVPPYLAYAIFKQIVNLSNG
jgi:DNA (cytosine-5)-methyltransferase 1